MRFFLNFDFRHSYGSNFKDGMYNQGSRYCLLLQPSLKIILRKKKTILMNVASSGPIKPTFYNSSKCSNRVRAKLRVCLLQGKGTLFQRRLGKGELLYDGSGQRVKQANLRSDSLTLENHTFKMKQFPND